MTVRFYGPPTILETSSNRLNLELYFMLYVQSLTLTQTQTNYISRLAPPVAKECMTCLLWLFWTWAASASGSTEIQDTPRDPVRAAGSSWAVQKKEDSITFRLEYFSEGGTSKVWVIKPIWLQAWSQILELKMVIHDHRREGRFPIDGCSWAGSSREACWDPIDHQGWDKSGTAWKRFRFSCCYKGTWARSWEKRLQKTLSTPSCSEWTYAQE